MWHRLLRRSLAAALLLGTLAAAPNAFAYTYYPPGPQGTVGVQRPVLSQQLVLSPGDAITDAQMWVDGVKVQPSWTSNGLTGLIRYTPRAPLAPGLHRVKLSVEVASGTAGQVYDPLVSEFTVSVSESALAEIPAPSAEEQRALDWLNRYRSGAGLPAATLQDPLNGAARAHAAYLAANPAQRAADPHGEKPGTPGFTGAAGADRVRYFGMGGQIAEVIDFTTRAEQAVDDWLATLYHRVPLVHPGLQAVGYGVAVGGGSRVNVMETSQLPDVAGVSPWPYPGQTDVPTEWDGAEEPNPLRLYPSVSGPVGYTVSLTFGGGARSVGVDRAELRGPEGSVDLLPFSPANDQYLTDTIAVIPARPLRPGATYQASFTGKVDLGKGPVPFERTWKFTTAAQRPPAVNRLSVRSEGDTVSRLTLTGTGFDQAMQVFIGGLPVAGVQVGSQTTAQVPLPAGAWSDNPSLLVVAGGREQRIENLTDRLGGLSLPAGAGAGGGALAARPLTVLGAASPAPALVLDSGAVLLPESALTALGAQVERIPAIDRSYWRLAGRQGDYTLGSTAAAVDGQPLALALPAQRRQGVTYVDAAFVARFAGLQVQQGPEGVSVGAAVEGMTDITFHWAREPIARLLRLGIVSGYGDGLFRPDATLTRAAFVKMLAGARGLAPSGGDGGFTDLAGHWVVSQGYLGAAVKAGLVVPAEYPSHSFEPDRAITREEMAVMIVRALGRDAQARSRKVLILGGTAYLGGQYFDDADSWSRSGYVAEAVELGIITGYPEVDGNVTFRPSRVATRAEAAVMTTRMLDVR